jgi:hypothetical protein
MIAIDTEEKLNWLVDCLENGEIILNNRKLTEEDRKEIRREIAELKAMQKTKIKEPVFI